MATTVNPGKGGRGGNKKRGGGSATTEKPPENLTRKSEGDIQTLINNGTIKPKDVVSLPDALRAAQQSETQKDKIEALRQKAIARGKDPSGLDSAWSRANLTSFQATMANPNGIPVSEVTAMLGYLRSGRERGANDAMIRKSIEGQVQHILKNAPPSRLAQIVKESDSPVLRRFLSVG